MWISCNKNLISTFYVLKRQILFIVIPRTLKSSWNLTHSRNINKNCSWWSAFWAYFVRKTTWRLVLNYKASDSSDALRCANYTLSRISAYVHWQYVKETGLDTVWCEGITEFDTFALIIVCLKFLHFVVDKCIEIGWPIGPFRHASEINLFYEGGRGLPIAFTIGCFRKALRRTIFQYRGKRS